MLRATASFHLYLSARSAEYGEIFIYQPRRHFSSFMNVSRFHFCRDSRLPTHAEASQMPAAAVAEAGWQRQPAIRRAMALPP